MGELVRVAAVSDIQPGHGKTVEPGGVEIALFNVAGTFHAISNVCLHRGGPLGEGDLDGTTVTCPWHGWEFDVTTGANVADPERAVRRYRVEVCGDQVFVELP